MRHRGLDARWRVRFPGLRVKLAVPVLAAALALSGCQSSGKSASPTKPTTPPAAATRRTAAACILVKQEDATALFGRAAKQVAVENSGGAESVCGWSASTDPDPNAVGAIKYSLLVYVYDDELHYTEKAAPSARRLDGIGERAFTVHAADLVTIEFVHKAQTVSIGFSITSLRPHPNARSSVDRLIALAKAAARRM